MHVGLQILDDFFKSDAAGGLNKILFFCQPPKGDPKGKNKLTFSDGREENLTGKCVYFVRVNPKVCLLHPCQSIPFAQRLCAQPCTEESICIRAHCVLLWLSAAVLWHGRFEHMTSDTLMKRAACTGSGCQDRRDGRNHGRNFGNPSWQFAESFARRLPALDGT